MIDGRPYLLAPDGCGDVPPGGALITRLDTDRIASIEVLAPGPAAERFGAAASGGAVIITTKGSPP